MRGIRDLTEAAEKASPPSDYVNPRWENRLRVHEWKNYISKEVGLMWETFSLEQKAAIARQADEVAGEEEWD